MPLDPAQLAQFKEWLREQSDRQHKVERIVEILLGAEFFAEPPVVFWNALEKHGISKQQFLQMSPDEQADAFRKVCKKPTETHADKFISVLDMILAERFGWPEGTVKDLTFRDVLVALEHATEHDDPSKPSIWKITK
jgi:hypothetical protein